MAERLSATVVGGGIAGLTAAVSLAQAGWTVAVLERAPAFGEVGAGLAITRNGMTALDAIGAGEAVRVAGHETVGAGIQDPSGRWLMRIPDTPGVRATTTIWGIHRRRLHAALLEAAEAADDVELVTGAEVSAVRPGRAAGEPASVTWHTAAGPHAAESDLVVAADGVRSTVRAQLFPHAHLRYSGSTSWRAVIPDTAADLGMDAAGRLVQVWGPGTEFGALRISDREIYWYGYFRHQEKASFGRQGSEAEGGGVVCERRLHVAHMQLVQVDVVGPEPYERCRARPADVAGGHVGAGDGPPGLVVRVAELRRDHDIVAPPPQGAAENALAVPGAVRVGGVEERDAQVDGPVDGANRLGVVHRAPAIGLALEDERPPDRPAAEADRADLRPGPAEFPGRRGHVDAPPAKTS